MNPQPKISLEVITAPTRALLVGRVDVFRALGWIVVGEPTSEIEPGTKMTRWVQIIYLLEVFPSTLTDTQPTDSAPETNARDVA